MNEEEKEFLKAQRSIRSARFFNDNLQIKEECEEMMKVDEKNSDVPLNNCTVIPSQDLLTTSQSTMSQNSNISYFEYKLPLKKETSKINIVTAEFVAALDRANVSSRNATYILAATLKSAGIDLQNINLSYSTIHRKRIRVLLREEIAIELKEKLKLDNNSVIHWDGKILGDIVGSDSVDRLPIVLISSGEEQLLGVLKINSVTGIDQASAVYSTLNHWGVSPYIKVICFDTTPANTGITVNILQFKIT